MSVEAMGSSRRVRALPGETGVVVVLLSLALWFMSLFPDYRSWANWQVILGSRAEIAIIAVGMTLVIATGGIDISVGSVVGLSAVVLGHVSQEMHQPAWVAVLAAILAGGFVGLLNGILIAKVRVPAIIATLATFSAARAGAYILSKGNSLSAPPEVSDLAYSVKAGMPVTIWMALAVLLGGWIVVRRTAFGRSVLAIGGNRQASQLSGVPTVRVEMLVYTLSGLLAGVAAIVVTARAGAIPDAGKHFELAAITAVVMGGTPVSGGNATIVGSALGVLCTGLVSSGVTTYKKDGIWEQLILGFILLAAIEVDRWRNAKMRK